MTRGLGVDVHGLLHERPLSMKNVESEVTSFIRQLVVGPSSLSLGLSVSVFGLQYIYVNCCSIR